ncbi:Imm21 family immunity protein [Nocardiopsis sp. NPDC055879]
MSDGGVNGVPVEWIGTLGGPLIVIPCDLLESWNGSEDGDYERACKVESYAGVISVGGGEALVLGGTPDLTAYIPYHRSFVRWGAAESEEQLLGLLEIKDSELSEVWSGYWFCQSKPWMLDAVWSGTEVDEYIELPFCPGRYLVRVFIVEGEASAAIVKMELCS